MSDGHRWAGEVYLMPLEEMVRRIELARLETADQVCGRCGSTTTSRPMQKWCPRCATLLAIACFSRDRSTSDGRRWACRACSARRNKAYRTRVARNGGIGVTGVVVRVSGRMRRAS